MVFTRQANAPVETAPRDSTAEQAKSLLFLHSSFEGCTRAELGHGRRCNIEFLTSAGNTLPLPGS